MSQSCCSKLKTKLKSFHLQNEMPKDIFSEAKSRSKGFFWKVPRIFHCSAPFLASHPPASGIVRQQGQLQRLTKRLQTFNCSFLRSALFLLAQMICLAKALYDNDAESPDELTLKRGDVLEVLERDYAGLAGWWLCSHKGDRGIVPGNRVRVLTGLPPPGDGGGGGATEAGADPAAGATDADPQWNRRSWHMQPNKVRTASCRHRPENSPHVFDNLTCGLRFAFRCYPSDSKFVFGCYPSA